MKVFFVGSPRALRELKSEHEAIYNAIAKAGHEHLSDTMIKANPDEFYKTDYDSIQAHYKESMSNLKKADVLVVEGSYNSMSLGYLVEKTLSMSKPVIILHLSEYEPYFFAGIKDEKLQILEYSLDTAKQVVKSALEYAIESADARFNFFVSPKHQNYMDWISKKRKIPRAVFLRRLIEREMDLDEGYRV